MLNVIVFLSAAVLTQAPEEIHIADVLDVCEGREAALASGEIQVRYRLDDDPGPSSRTGEVVFEWTDSGDSYRISTSEPASADTPLVVCDGTAMLLRDGTLWEAPSLNIDTFPLFSEELKGVDDVDLALRLIHLIKETLLFPLSQNTTLTGQWMPTDATTIEFPDAESYVWFFAETVYSYTPLLREEDYAQVLELWGFDLEHKFPIAMGASFDFEQPENFPFQWSGSVVYDNDTLVPEQVNLEGESQLTVVTVKPRDTDAAPITIDSSTVKRRISEEQINSSQKSKNERVRPFRTYEFGAMPGVLALVTVLLLGVGVYRISKKAQEAGTAQKEEPGGRNAGNVLITLPGIMLCIEWLNFNYQMWNAHELLERFTDLPTNLPIEQLLGGLLFVLLVYSIPAFTLLATCIGFIRRRKRAVLGVGIILLGYLAIFLLDTVLPFYRGDKYVQLSPSATSFVFALYLFALLIAARHWKSFR